MFMVSGVGTTIQSVISHLAGGLGLAAGLGMRAQD